MNPVRSIFPFFFAACIAFSPAVLAETDPPGRVARLALADGAVFLFDHETREWADAHVNWPVTTDDVLHSGSDARAELRIGSGAIRLDSDSEMEVRQIDDQQIRIWLEYGSVALRVRSHDPADWITVDTRDGRVLATEPGQYRIDYADGVTTLTAHRGELAFFADDSQTTVADGQRIEVRYSQRTTYRRTAIVRDAFADWYLARDVRDDAHGQPQYVSAEMTGAEELTHHGSWTHYADHGPVWVPHHVPSGWVPYRYGRWVWVRPWGWTWLDDAPWGFAPFHYGRWAMMHGRWAWIPGAYETRPVYAPALVAWIGSSGWRVGFASGSAPAAGWFPLAPREVYVPYYRATPAHIRRLNARHVTHIAHIDRWAAHPRRHWQDYRNHRDAATVVPASAMWQRRPVHRDAVRDAVRWMRDAQVADAAPIRVRQGSDPGQRARSQRLEGERMKRSTEDQVRHPATRAPGTIGTGEQTRPRDSTARAGAMRRVSPASEARPTVRDTPPARDRRAVALRPERSRADAGGLEAPVASRPARAEEQARRNMPQAAPNLRGETTSGEPLVQASTPIQTREASPRSERKPAQPLPPHVDGLRDPRRAEGSQTGERTASGRSAKDPAAGRVAERDGNDGVVWHPRNSVGAGAARRGGAGWSGEGPGGLNGR